MKHVVYRIFPSGVPKCIEETERKVAARIDSEANFGDKVISSWCCLGLADRACIFESGSSLATNGMLHERVKERKL